jgi:hypothetical protein
MGGARDFRESPFDSVSAFGGNRIGVPNSYDVEALPLDLIESSTIDGDSSRVSTLNGTSAESGTMTDGYGNYWSASGRARQVGFVDDLLGRKKDLAISANGTMVYDVGVAMANKGFIPSDYLGAANSYRDLIDLTFVDSSQSQFNTITDWDTGKTVGRSFLLHGEGDDQDATMKILLKGLGGAGRALYANSDWYRSEVGLAVTSAIQEGKVDVSKLQMVATHFAVAVGLEQADSDPDVARKISGFSANYAAHGEQGFKMTPAQYATAVKARFVSNDFLGADGAGESLLPPSTRFIHSIERVSSVIGAIAEIALIFTGARSPGGRNVPKLQASPKEIIQAEKEFFQSLTNKGEHIPRDGFNMDANKFKYFYGKIEKPSDVEIAEFLKKYPDKDPLHNFKRSKQIDEILKSEGMDDTVLGRERLLRLFESAKKGPQVEIFNGRHGTTITRMAQTAKVKYNVKFFYENGDLTKTPSVVSLIPKVKK